MLLTRFLRPARLGRHEVSTRFLSTPGITFEQPGAATPTTPRTKRPKHKVPQKRSASTMLNILQKLEMEKLVNGRVYPEIHAGDSVEIEKLQYMSSKEPVFIRGVVLGKFNRKSDTSIVILNVEFGIPVQRRIPIYSPVILNIKILQKAFIHNGKKRVRRSKLYYLLERDPEEYTVK